MQIRSKVAPARELIDITRQAAQVIADAGKSDEVALLVDDRLDVILATRKEGIKVDGIHVGQSDIPVAVCREYLGEDSIIGLSARTHDFLSMSRQWMFSGLIISAPDRYMKPRPNPIADLKGKLVLINYC